MAFMDDFKKKLGEIGKAAEDKATVAIEVSQLKAKINNEEARRDESYKAVGKYVFEILKETTVDDFLIKHYTTIESCNKTIEDAQARINELKKNSDTEEEANEGEKPEETDKVDAKDIENNGTETEQ